VNDEPVRCLSGDDLPELLKSPLRGGWAVTLKWVILRVPTSMITKTYRTRKLAVTVLKKSQARIAWA
jgi:hypothetical protein